MKRPMRWRKFAEHSVTMLMLMIAVYALLGAYREKKSGDPFFFLGFKPVFVLSNSMEPTMPEGSIALVKEQKDIPKVGDVVMFETSVLGHKMLVTHRIIREEQEGFVTKGDNNPIEDQELLNQERVKGAVVFVLKLPQKNR